MPGCQQEKIEWEETAAVEKMVELFLRMIENSRQEFMGHSSVQNFTKAVMKALNKASRGLVSDLLDFTAALFRVSLCIRGEENKLQE